MTGCVMKLRVRRLSTSLNTNWPKAGRLISPFGSRIPSPTKFRRNRKIIENVMSTTKNPVESSFILTKFSYNLLIGGRVYLNHWNSSMDGVENKKKLYNRIK